MARMCNGVLHFLRRISKIIFVLLLSVLTISIYIYGKCGKRNETEKKYKSSSCDYKIGTKDAEKNFDEKETKVLGECGPIPYNVPLEEIAKKIEYQYAYACSFSDTAFHDYLNRFEELNLLSEGKHWLTIYIAEGNKVLFLPEGAGNTRVLVNGELCELYASEEREGYLFYYIEDFNAAEGGVPINAAGCDGGGQWANICILEGESQPDSDERYYVYYDRFDANNLYKLGEIEVFLDAQRKVVPPDFSCEGNEYIEAMVRAAQETLSEKGAYGEFEMFLGRYGRTSDGFNHYYDINATAFWADGYIAGNDLEQYFFFNIEDNARENRVIGTAYSPFQPNDEEWKMDQYYFTGGYWLNGKNQEYRIQKIKDLNGTGIPFTVLAGQEYSAYLKEEDTSEEVSLDTQNEIDFYEINANVASDMLSYLCSYSEWFGMNELGYQEGEIRGFGNREVIMYLWNEGVKTSQLLFVPVDKVNRLFIGEDFKMYPMYINGDGKAEFYKVMGNPAAVKNGHLKTTLCSTEMIEKSDALAYLCFYGKGTLEIQDLPSLEVPEVENDEYVQALEEYIKDTLKQDGKFGEYKVYIGEYEAMDESRVCLSAAVSGNNGEEYYFRYLIIRSHKEKYYFWPAGFGLDGSLTECSAGQHYMNAVCIERTKQLRRRESIISITL